MKYGVRRPCLAGAALILGITSGGCSLVIDSGKFVETKDAGGSTDAGRDGGMVEPDGGPAPRCDPDQPCPPNLPACDIVTGTCVECLGPEHCPDFSRPVCEQSTRTCMPCPDILPDGVPPPPECSGCDPFGSELPICGNGVQEGCPGEGIDLFAEIGFLRARKIPAGTGLPDGPMDISMMPAAAEGRVAILVTTSDAADLGAESNIFEVSVATPEDGTRFQLTDYIGFPMGEGGLARAASDPFGGRAVAMFSKETDGTVYYNLFMNDPAGAGDWYSESFAIEDSHSAPFALAFSAGLPAAAWREGLRVKRFAHAEAFSGGVAASAPDAAIPNALGPWIAVFGPWVVAESNEQRNVVVWNASLGAPPATIDLGASRNPSGRAAIVPTFDSTVPLAVLIQTVDGLAKLHIDQNCSGTNLGGCVTVQPIEHGIPGGRDLSITSGFWIGVAAANEPSFMDGTRQVTGRFVDSLGNLMREGPASPVISFPAIGGFDAPLGEIRAVTTASRDLGNGEDHYIVAGATPAAGGPPDLWITTLRFCSEQ